MTAALSVLLAGVPGTSVPPWLATAIREGLGGVTLFGENTPDLLTTRRLTDALRSHREDLVVSIDEEGGDVTRLQAAGGSPVPGAAALGVLDDPALTEEQAYWQGKLLLEVGIDLDLAPVLDVASEPANPVIGVRSFGDSAELVTRHGQAYAQGLARAGVASCAKHFPGHGDTRTDTHLGMGVVEADRGVLERRELPPFFATGTDAVMTAHVVVPVLGAGPASLSSWATQLLRDNGFTGAVITDALGMAAITRTRSIGEACVLALQAGADLLCLDSPANRDAEQTLLEARTAIEQALADGRLDPAALERSADRVGALHRPVPEFSAERANRAVDELASIGARIAEDSLQTHGEVRLSGVPHIVDLRRRHHLAAGRSSSALLAALLERFPAATTGEPQDPLPRDAQLLVITREPSAAPEEEQLHRLLDQHPHAVVLHTGLAAAAPRVARLICCHGVSRAGARAAARALAGAPATPDRSAGPAPGPSDPGPRRGGSR